MARDEVVGTIELIRPDRRYLPGDLVEGSASWSLEKRPSRILIRLAYRITRIGERRVRPGAVAELAFVNPMARGGCDFRFRLPYEPYSFDGKLFSIGWAVDLRVPTWRGDRRLAATSLTMSPTGDPR